ncbi:hypothetical protein DCAR_0205576 [Daucus carota subsp. sativus]|uniref:Zinc finger GRF-type domain-containing protein n=1 Tax=Daucus carota subsp. sativus TaxID=79200 RepID=A0AAF0WDN7_DAUCS|nr:hypothetical protein DCAR_0205576 [Daucus carota subsp. sativus]
MAEKCLCGNVVIQQTSWTQTNPGRRFAACVDRRCNKLSRWLEEPVCSRAQVIIPGLLRRINKLEEEKMELEAKLTKNVVIIQILEFIFMLAYNTLFCFPHCSVGH